MKKEDGDQDKHNTSSGSVPTSDRHRSMSDPKDRRSEILIERF